MLKSKILLNITDEPIFHDATGITFYPNSPREIPNILLASISDQAMFDLLTSGAMIFSDGASTLLDPENAWTALLDPTRL